MWSIARLVVARQLRASGAVYSKNAGSLASRVAGRQASFTIPSGYRFHILARGFAESRGRQAKAAEASSTKTATRKKAKKPAKKPKAKKAAPKKPAKKVLSDEEKLKLKIRELKKVALLGEPKKLPDRPWLVYLSQHTKGTKAEGSLGSLAKQVSESFKAISAAELEVRKTGEHKLTKDPG
jgi:hypothetical protein